MALLEKKSIIQFIKYFITGALSVCIAFPSFVLFNYLGIHYVAAVFLSFTLGTLTNFAICNAFVFDRGCLSLVEAGARHYLSSAGGFLVNMGTTIFLVEVLSFQSLFLKSVAQLIAIGCAFIFNFTFIKFFAFNFRIALLPSLKSPKQKFIKTH